MTERDSHLRVADWFRQWRKPLRSFLSGRSAVAAQDLDDIAQEVFLRLMRYDRTELVQHPQTYLYRIAVNVATEWSLRERPTLPLDDASPELIAEERADDTAAWSEFQDEIERGLKVLTPQQRTIVRMQFHEELTRAEIAARVGGTERSVKRALIKSYEKLRHELNPELLRGMWHGRE